MISHKMTSATESVQSPVSSEPIMKESKVNKFFNIRRVLRFALLVFMIYISFQVYTGLRNSSRIYPSDSKLICQKFSTNSCIEFDAKIMGGWAKWEVKKGWPFSFSMSTEGFADKDSIKITCPITHSKGNNETLSKIKFFFNGDNIKGCVVS